MMEDDDHELFQLSFRFQSKLFELLGLVLTLPSPYSIVLSTRMISSEFDNCGQSWPTTSSCVNYREFGLCFAVCETFVSSRVVFLPYRYFNFFQGF